MVKRKELLRNVRNYSPQEIADAIRCGVVSMYDLSKETGGAFTPLLKKHVKVILNEPIHSPQAGAIDHSASELVTSTQQTIAAPTSNIVTSAPVSEPLIPTTQPSIPVVSFTGQLVQEEVATPTNNTSLELLSSTPEDNPAMFSRIFSFKGRIRRLEYGLTYLAYSLWNFPTLVMSEDQISRGYAIFYLVTLFPILWILFAQGAKRCHDRGNSGWYQLIPYYVLWMLFAKGTPNTNEYGPSPK